MQAQKSATGASGRSRAHVEELEARTLFSTASIAAAAAAAQEIRPNVEYLTQATPAAASGTPAGYTPAEILKAYGFDQITLGDGTVAADGTGQTIAIVDAYNHPNIAADLKVFNAQFGLPDADLTVVNQTGGSTLPATDAGWAGEIALDVEWAHAIAPGARILLVEANSATTEDLLAAVDYARNAAGVSVVSMSWGGSEFFSWGGGESESQLTYDPYFTTPAGHTGVTFIAAAGDSGTASGVMWPSASPNVMSVGGTSLYTSDDSGTYEAEGAWRGFRSGTNGGFSQVEPEPDYQQVVQQTGARSAPDVGYDADPNTGFAVYDSLAYNGQSGWSVIGGTSAGAPQWAALVAIADQGRAMRGLDTLDGATQTLPALYGLYSAPGTAGYSTTYTAAFNDIGNDGYGYTTGLGSPHAGPIVTALVATAPDDTAAGGTGGSGSGGTSGSGGGSSGSATTTPSPLSATFSNVPVSGLEGDQGSAKIRLTNTSNVTFDGPVTITLYASADGAVSADDAVVTTVTLSDLRLRAGAAKTVKAKFAFPTGLADGAYALIASAAATGTNAAAALATAPIALAAPRVDLAAAFATAQPIELGSGKSTAVKVTVQNLGNVTATGSAALKVYASADGSRDGSDVLVGTVQLGSLRLKPGQTKTVRLRLSTSALVGERDLIAALTPAADLDDANASNDLAVAVIG